MTDISLTYRARQIHLSPLLHGALETYRLWRRRARERTELSRMPARELADLGITEGRRNLEVMKPFWRA